MFNFFKLNFDSSHLESLRDDLESSFDQSTLCIISSLTPLALKHSWTTIARFLGTEIQKKCSFFTLLVF